MNCRSPRRRRGDARRGAGRSRGRSALGEAPCSSGTPVPVRRRGSRVSCADSPCTRRAAARSSRSRPPARRRSPCARSSPSARTRRRSRDGSACSSCRCQAGRHARGSRSCAPGRTPRTHACRPRDPSVSGPAARALEPDLLGLQVLANLTRRSPAPSPLALPRLCGARARRARSRGSRTARPAVAGSAAQGGPSRAATPASPTAESRARPAAVRDRSP